MKVALRTITSSLLLHRAQTRGLAAAALVLLVTVTASFALTQRLHSGQQASADVPPEGTPWYWPLLQAEEAAPRPQGTFGGITINPATDIEIAVCVGAEARQVDIQAARGGPLDTRPAYLPPGAVPIQSAQSALDCDGVIAWAEEEWWVPFDTATGRYGGPLSVYRALEKSATLDYAANRVHETVIGSRSALIVEPLTEDGFGNSAIVIDEPFGITIIHADGITTAELRRVADSLTTQ